MHLSLIIIKR